MLVLPSISLFINKLQSSRCFLGFRRFSSPSYVSHTRFSPSFKVQAGPDPMYDSNRPLVIVKPLKKRISPLAVIRSRSAGRCKRAISAVVSTAKPGYYFSITPNLSSLLMPPDNLTREFAYILIDMNLHTPDTFYFIAGMDDGLKCKWSPFNTLESLVIGLHERAKADRIEEEITEQFQQMVKELMMDRTLFEIVCSPTLGDAVAGADEKKWAFRALTTRIAFHMHLEYVFKLILRLNRPHLIDFALAYLERSNTPSEDAPTSAQNPKESQDWEYTQRMITKLLKRDPW